MDVSQGESSTNEDERSQKSGWIKKDRKQQLSTRTFDEFWSPSFYEPLARFISKLSEPPTAECLGIIGGMIYEKKLVTEDQLEVAAEIWNRKTISTVNNLPDTNTEELLECTYVDEPPSRRKRKQKPSKCSECGKVFFNKTSMDRHIKEVHQEPDKKIECQLCSFSTKRAENLQNHMKRAHQLQELKSPSLDTEH